MSNEILKILRIFWSNTKPISAKSHGSNINLHSLKIKLLNAGKVEIKKNYGFDEVLNV